MVAMAVSGALGALQSLVPGSAGARARKFQQSFQQLGQDLQSGNTVLAENDLSSARANLPVNPLYTQSFNQIAQDLKLNNLSAAQSDYATLQQNLGSAVTGAAQPLKFSSANQAASQIQQLSQSWDSPHQSAAHRAYTALRGEMAAFTPFGNTLDPTSSSQASGGLNVTA